MKFLADENISRSVVKGLREIGLDIIEIRALIKEANDQELLDTARKEDRIILTHDKDFGNIIRQAEIFHNSVIIIRCKNQSSQNILSLISKVIDSRILNEISKSVTIISETHMTVYRN